MAVHVPLTDAASRVPGCLQRFAEGNGFGIQRHIVKKNAVGQRTLSSQQGSPRGGTDRQAGDGVDKSRAFSGQTIKVRCFDIGITGESKCLSPPLIGEDDEDVRARRRFFGACRAASSTDQGKQQKVESFHEFQGSLAQNFRRVTEFEGCRLDWNAA
jgi:hypothetical protein